MWPRAAREYLRVGDILLTAIEPNAMLVSYQKPCNDMNAITQKIGLHHVTILKDHVIITITSLGTCTRLRCNRKVVAQVRATRSRPHKFDCVPSEARRAFCSGQVGADWITNDPKLCYYTHAHAHKPCAQPTAPTQYNA